MTLRPEDFVVTWKTDVPEGDKPATYSEVVTAMERLNDKALRATPGEVIQITVRTPVADAIIAGINNNGFGRATKDVYGDPRFVPEKGGYQSTLYVAQNQEILTHYIDSI